MRKGTVLLIAAMLLGSVGVAQARPAGKPEATTSPPAGPARGAGLGSPTCAHFLLNAHPATLKSQLNLSDEQLKQFENLRTNLQTEFVKARSQIQQNQVKMSELMEARNIDESKVLELQRKNAALREDLVQRGLKAYLAFVKMLDTKQRAALNSECPRMAARYHGGGGPMGEMSRTW